MEYIHCPFINEACEINFYSSPRLLDIFQEPKQKGRDFGGSLKRKGIESDEDSPPRKMPSHRRMAVVYDSDEE